MGFLVICGLLLPFLGSQRRRRYWSRFRSEFASLFSSPLLDYHGALEARPGRNLWHYFGDFESVTDDKLLWIKHPRLTMAAEIARSRIFLLERDRLRPIRWEELDSLSEGTRIFIGGEADREARRFISTAEKPLIILLFDGGESGLSSRVLSAAREENSYWNAITPYALALATFGEFLLALFLSRRPALTLAANLALTAAFTPMLPFVPPALGFTLLAQKLFGKAHWHEAIADCRELLGTGNGRAEDKKKARLLKWGAAGLLSAGIALNACICYILISSIR